MGICAASSERRTSAPALGPSVTVSSIDEVLDDRRLLRERREQLDRPLQRIPVAQRHGDDRCPQVGLELSRRALGDDAPVVDHHDVAGQAVGLFEVLRGQQDRRAVADQLLDGNPQALAALGVEARRRLVEEEDRRIRHQRGGQVQPPAHAARVRLEHAIAGAGQPEGLEQLVGPARRHLAAQVREAAHHVDVLPAREVLVDGGVLAGEPDGAADRIGLGDHVVAEHRGASRVGAEDGGEDAHDRGLARPVRTEQAQHGAGLHLERDAVEGAHLAVGEDLDEVVGLDGECGIRRKEPLTKKLSDKVTYVSRQWSRKELAQQLRSEIMGYLGAASDFDERLAKKLKLSRTDMRCLDLIGRLGPMTAGRLAEESGLTTGAVTFILDRLEQSGMVTRRRDTEDRRRVWVEIVPEARHRLEVLQQPVAEEMRQVAQRFKADELAIVRDFMRQAKEVFQRQISGGPAGQGERARAPTPAPTLRAVTAAPEGPSEGK